ncbi:hypothetical protein MC885_012887 [Smutsia gigantea]|nr:hypothetical protein MC885_012887 [Smutsia gigantea]
MGLFPTLWGWVLTVAALSTGATASFVEQTPRWVLVRHGQPGTLHCILQDSQYPWMSWYQQDHQGQLQVLATLRSPRDEEVASLPGADYRVTRVNSSQLRLHVANVTQGRMLYCACSKDTVRNPPRRMNKNHPVPSHRPALRRLCTDSPPKLAPSHPGKMLREGSVLERTRVCNP